jgi:ferritin-like metal-binding protein YciE
MLDKQQLKELLLQALEHERGGVNIYETAIRCALSEHLKHEWSQYLEQTHTHVRMLEQLLKTLEIDPEQAAPGRDIVRGLGDSLVAAMQNAKAAGTPTAAQLVACVCVVLAGTKDHSNRELLTKCAAELGGAQKQALEEACELAEQQDDEHPGRGKGYRRELWLDALDLPAVLPPPEEAQRVLTASSAAQAQQQSVRHRYSRVVR